MSLTGALSIAASGLSSSETALSVISQNLAASGVPGDAAEIDNPVSIAAVGIGAGVRTQSVTLASDPLLSAQLQSQNSLAAGLQTRSNALTTLDPALGSVGAGTDLGSQVQALQSSFSTLLTDPADQVNQSAVIQAAATLAGNINQIAQGYATASQSAQDDLVSSVQTLQTALTQIGTLSDQIIAQGGTGASTADLQNARNQAANTVASLVDARFVVQPNGDMVVMTAGGAQLPTRGTATLSVASAQTSVGSYYPGGGLPGVMLGNADITSMMTGGTIGADLTLRDTTLPTDQAELDSFSQTLASRFAAQGLTLFSDGAGNVPGIGTAPTPQAPSLGFSSAIQVNPAVVANPALVRDGTQAVAGSATGASAFTPNPSGGLPGFSTLITRVLDYSFGTEVQAGVTQPPGLSASLGPAGTLTAPYAAPATLADNAQALVQSQSADSATASSDLADATALQSSLQTKFTGQTGVDTNTEMTLMIQLQNAYAANAKIVSAVQSMLTTTLAMVQ